jgi:radical SAM superfamily enzyme YgiQ (UPF0313 family)
MQNSHVLFIDLNNFARYPTLAIAYLIAPLRQAGFQVDLLSPLSFNAPTVERESKETWQEHIKRRVYFSTHSIMLKLHNRLRAFYAQQSARPHAATIAAIEEKLQQKSVHIILLSAYLSHYPTVKIIAKLAQQAEIPVLLGGPAFNDKQVVQQWIDLQGITGIFAGEADLLIADLVTAMIQQQDLTPFAGLFLKSNIAHMQQAAPLQAMERLPIPDFSDFPWNYYQHKIIPIMTGRGCNWGVCTFCSDVTTANGRTFRSRPIAAVLEEIRLQAQRYHSQDFIFLDIKLNSNVAMWRTLITNFQEIVPNGHWIATVHVNVKGENGLSLAELTAARQSGLIRMSFGLETGSKKLNRRMGKGTTMQRNAQFVEDAYQAGISLRASMMLGYPSETAEDIWQSVAFLTQYQNHFDRIRLSRFKIIPNTRFATLYNKRPSRFAAIKQLKWNYRYARADYKYPTAADKAYRQAKRALLTIIHKINQQPLRDAAVQFDGLM